MVNIIRIKGASFYGYHGVMSEEQNVGGKYEADVDIYTDFAEASAHDKLTETIDYQKVYSFLHKLVQEHKYYLIESIATKISDELLLNFLNIQKIAVRVRKQNPPMGGVVDCVEVEVIKTREDLHKSLPTAGRL
jgi:7,8-dihydroneopterin aldolase/epimerase/oxygenase